MKEEYIYSVQAAFLLQKTMREIQHMCEKGRLRATKITKGKEKLLIDASSVEVIFYKQISRYNRVYKYLNLSEEERLDYWNNVEKNIQIKLNTVDYLSLKQVAYLLNVSGQAVTTMIDTKEVMCFNLFYKGRERKFIDEISLAKFVKRRLDEIKKKYKYLISYINTENKMLFWEEHEEDIEKIIDFDNKKRVRQLRNQRERERMSKQTETLADNKENGKV